MPSRAYIRQEIRRQVQAELRSERIIRRNAIRLYGGVALGIITIGGLLGWAIAALIG
jgi:hypothetical protein